MCAKHGTITRPLLSHLRAHPLSRVHVAYGMYHDGRSLRCFYRAARQQRARRCRHQAALARLLPQRSCAALALLGPSPSTDAGEATGAPPNTPQTPCGIHQLARTRTFLFERRRRILRCTCMICTGSHSRRSRSRPVGPTRRAARRAPRRGGTAAAAAMAAAAAAMAAMAAAMAAARKYNTYK